LAPAESGTSPEPPEAGTPGQPDGDGAAPEATGEAGPGAPEPEATFFDPAELPDELKPAYKQMQKAFTKKTQEIAKHKQKVEAFDAFSKDPVGSLKAMAQRLGLQVVGHGENPQQQAAAQPENWEPQTWDEVMARAKAEAKKEIMHEMSPFLSEMQNLKRTTLERTLDEAAPDWRMHEDRMVELLNEHPTLANNPEMLYRMAVPPDELQARATQAALKKLQAKASSAKAAGGSTTNKKPEVRQDANSFDEAVRVAQAELEARGIRPA
jgi:hypothetical protein